MKVQVYIYDLSMGLAAQLSSVFLGKHIEGVWHTGIVVFGKEYFFGGSGIEYCPPGGTVMGRPHKIHDLGETHVPFEVFQDFLLDIRDKFNPQTYDLFGNNCNNFSNELAEFLTGQSIPEYIVNLPSEVLETPFGRQLRPMLDRMQNQNIPERRLLQPLDSTNSSSGSKSVSSSSTATGPPATAPSTTSSASASSSQRVASSDKTSDCGIQESSVRRIVQNGFTRTEAIEELKKFSGDTDHALASLFAKALKF